MPLNLRPATLALLCIAGWSLAGRAQRPPAQPPVTFRTGVDLVEVDVSVLDKDRRPVRGLTRENFTILEDGKPRPAVAFAAVDLVEREASPARASWVRDVAPDVTANALRPEGRLVVIMFDWSIRFLDQVLAKRIATAAVDALGPDDLAAVVFSSGFGNAGTPQNFTADRSRLLASINRPWAVAAQNAPVGPGHDPRNSNEVMIEDPEGYLSGDCQCRTCVPETIARIADAVRDVRGRRKTLIFIGTYFRAEESLQGPASRQGGPPGFLRSPEITPVRPGLCSAPLDDAREKMVRAAALANLTIQTFDPVGLETQTNSPLGGSKAGQLERRDGLAVPADLTGGRTVMNTETPEAHIPAVFAETDAYYLLAFAPADTRANGRVHKIEVKVDHPGVNVRTRSGFVTEPVRTTGGKPTIGSPETIAALKGVLPRADVPLRVSVAPFAIPGKAESAVAIVLGARQQVPADLAGKSATVKLLTAAFGWDGKSADSVDQTIGVTWRPDASGSSRYEIVSRLTLKPGRYEVRVALDASLNQRGSVYTYVDVPDFAKQPLSLSGLVLAVSPSVSSAGREALANLVPVVPTAQREFARTDRATAFLQVYQDAGRQDAGRPDAGRPDAGKPPQPAGVTARITDTGDRIVFDQVTELPADRFAGNRGADYRLELPLERLEPGEYLLTIDASQGQRTVRRGLRFTVR
jgi:VWFA-related protein